MPKAVLITGAAKRLGRVIALHLATHGWDIALHCHTSRAEAEGLCAEITGMGRQCAVFQKDLMLTSALPELVAQVMASFPHCTALVHNASLFEEMPFLEADEAAFDRALSIHLKAPTFLTQACAHHWETQHMDGTVVSVLDSAITRHQHRNFFYLLSKKALLSFTQMAAATLGPRVRVNAICPGVVLPGPEPFGEAYMARIAADAPLKRTATPEEVAQQVRWLLETPGLTGQCLFVDGGVSLR